MIISLIAGIYLVAAGRKLLWRARFEEVLHNYQVLPFVVVPFFGWLIPIGELAIAANVVLWPSLGAALAATAFVVYGVILASLALRRIELEDCGCAWGEKAAGKTLWMLGVRNMLLASVALILVGAESEPNPSSFEMLNGIGGAIVVAVLWLALATLRANWRQMKATGHA